MWNKIHFLFAITLLVLFLMTGLYMNSQFPELYAGDQVIRYMYRSSHIYLLLAAVVHLSLSHSRTLCRPRLLLTKVSNSLIIGASLVLLIAFIIEPANKLESRLITQIGLLILLITSVFYSLLHWVDQRKGA